MKRYLFINILFVSCLIQATDKKERLIDSSEHTQATIHQRARRIIDPTKINYSLWDLHITTIQTGITIKEWRLKDGPEKIPVKQNCLLHLFACLCCSKTILDNRKKLIQEYEKDHDYSWNEKTVTMQRFYRYR